MYNQMNCLNTFHHYLKKLKEADMMVPYSVKCYIGICILLQVPFLYVKGLGAPSFVSSWHRLRSQDDAQGHVSIVHNLYEYPVKVDVQAKVNENGEDYIFTGIGSAHRDDDRDAEYGGVMYAYSSVDVLLYVPVSTLLYDATTKGQAAFTGGGQYEGSDRINDAYTECEVRVRLWRLCDFGDPVFVEQSLIIDDNSNTFKEVTHNLGFYPDVVSVQIYLGDGYVSDAQGSVSVGNNYDAFQAIGGVVYGYDRRKIRLWAPKQDGNDFNGAIFTIIDGWGGSPEWYKNSGVAKIIMWSFPADEIAFTQTLTPFGIGIDTSPYEIDFPESYSIDDYYITVEVQPDTGENKDCRFPGAGSCMGEGSAGLGTFGGVVYVYSARRVLLYRPADDSGGKLVYIGDRWGNGAHPQASNTGSLIVKAFTASGAVKGACGHGTCSPDLSLLSVTCDCSSTSYSGANCKSRPSCPVPDDVENAMKQYNGTGEGDYVIYSCNFRSYLSSGIQQRICTSGTWNGSLPVCSELKCSDPGDVVHAVKSLGGTAFGDAVSYTCEPGYNLTSGDSNRSCQFNGTWDGSPPICTAVKCADPPPSTGSIQHSEGYYAGDVATYSCSVGYVQTSGDNILTCLNNGTWDKDALVCTPVVCPTPDSGPNSIVSYTTLSYGSSATYTCSSGYAVVDGDTIRYCWSVGSSTGEWSGSSAECQELTIAAISITYITPNATLEVKLQQLRKETEISKNSTSAYRRSLISVYDSRPSSVYIGSVGIIMLSLIFGFMLLADCSKICGYLRK